MKHRGILRSAGLALALTAAMPALASTASVDDVQVVRAHFADPAVLERITPLLGHAQVDRAKGVLRVESDPWLRAQLIAAGLRVEVDEEATLATRQALQGGRGPMSIPGYACYRTVEEAATRISDLAINHPTLASLVNLGPSWLAAQGSGGYQMRVLKLTNSAIPGPKPVLFMTSSIHAREYTPAELTLRFAEELLAGYGTDANATFILDHHEVHVLVHSNPDGRKQAETGKSWRKNVNNAFCPNTDTRGVDLNRNFAFEWGAHNGSSPSACNETFRGPSAGSEPETQAIAQHMRNVYSDLRGPNATDAAPDTTPGIYIDIHSYSQLVLWPWGYTTTPSPNAIGYQSLGRRLAGFNNYTAQASVGLYPTDGTTDDYAYGELGVASLTFELGSAFFESCSSFESTVLPTNRAALRYAARALRAPYMLAQGPDAEQVRVEPDLILAGDTATVEATFNDQRQQTGSAANSGPVPAVQPIAGGSAWVQTPPWLPGASAAAMSAIDGSFNTTIEGARATIDTDGLASGTHLVYVQGRDSSGANGPYGAAFLEVVAADDAATLSGTVRDVGTGAPLQAQVRVNNWYSQSAANGGYARLLRAGSWPVTVTAPGYEREQIPSLTVNAGESLTRDFSLFRLCPMVSDPVDVSGSSPFTAQTPWTRRAGVGQDGGAAWLQSASGNYGNNLNTSLTSAALNLSGYNSTTLTFDQRCDTEAGWDYGIVEVSVNGGSSWSEVARCNGESNWRRVELALPQLDNQANARLRFRFTSDSNTVDTGWALDNISLTAGGGACRAGQIPAVSVDTLSATPNQIDRGQSTTLAWTTRNAAGCTLSDNIGGAGETLGAGELASGMRTVSPTQTAVYSLSCTGHNGPSSLSVPVTVRQPVAISSLGVTPAQIVQGASAQIAWSTQNATGCTLDEGTGAAAITLGAGELASGTRNFAPNADATVSLTCTGVDGPVNATASIDVLPRVVVSSLSATPAQIERGTSTQLSWNTQHASACTLSDDQGGSPVVLGAGERDAGTRQVSPTVDTQYTLSCDGDGGPASRQVSVDVLPPPVAIAQFAVQPAQVIAGETAMLQWTTSDATDCTIAMGAGAPETVPAPDRASGQRPYAPMQSTTWTLTCQGRNGPVTAQATLNVVPPSGALLRDGFETPGAP